MQPQSAAPDLLKALNTVMPANPADTSVHDYLDRSVGDLISKVITINGDDATVNVPCFTLTGSVEVLKIYGQILTKTVLDSCTNIHFDLYDATAAYPISKTTTATPLTNLAVGTMFIKNADASAPLAVADNATGSIIEAPLVTKEFAPFILTAKTGATNTIRFNYTTAGNAQNSTFKIWVEYRPLNGGTLTAV